MSLFGKLNSLYNLLIGLINWEHVSFIQNPVEVNKTETDRFEAEWIHFWQFSFLFSLFFLQLFVWLRGFWVAQDLLSNVYTEQHKKKEGLIGTTVPSFSLATTEKSVSPLCDLLEAVKVLHLANFLLMPVKQCRQGLSLTSILQKKHQFFLFFLFSSLCTNLFRDRDSATCLCSVAYHSKNTCSIRLTPIKNQSPRCLFSCEGV